MTYRSFLGSGMMNGQELHFYIERDDDSDRDVLRAYKLEPVPLPAVVLA